MTLPVQGSKDDIVVIAPEVPYAVVLVLASKLRMRTAARIAPPRLGLIDKSATMPIEAFIRLARHFDVEQNCLKLSTICQST